MSPFEGANVNTLTDFLSTTLPTIVSVEQFPAHMPFVHLCTLETTQLTADTEEEERSRHLGTYVHVLSLSFGPGTDADLIHPLTPQQKHDLTLRQSQSNSESIKMCPYSARERNDSLMHNHTATQSHIHSLKCSCILQYGLCCL